MPTYYLMKDGCVVTLGSIKNGYRDVKYFPATGFGPFAWTKCESYYTYKANPDGSIPYVMKTTDIRTMKYFIDNRIHEKIQYHTQRALPDCDVYKESCAIKCSQCGRVECDQEPFTNNWVVDTTETKWCPECYIQQASDIAECVFCGDQHIKTILRNFDDSKIGKVEFSVCHYQIGDPSGNRFKDRTMILCHKCEETKLDRYLDGFSDGYSTIKDINYSEIGHEGHMWVDDYH